MAAGFSSSKLTEHLENAHCRIQLVGCIVHIFKVGRRGNFLQPPVTAIQAVQTRGMYAAAANIQDNTGRLLKHMAAAADDLDVLFAELDTNLAQSKQVFSQIASSSPAPALDAAGGSNAAWAAFSSINTEAAAAHSAALGLRVPAYVHVGDPLTIDEPSLDSAVSTLETQHINW